MDIVLIDKILSQPRTSRDHKPVFWWGRDGTMVEGAKQRRSEIGLDTGHDNIPFRY